MPFTAFTAFTAFTTSVLNATKMSYSSLTYRVTARNSFLTAHNLPPNPKPVNYAAHCTQNAGKSSASLSSLSLVGGVSPIGSATRLCFALERKKKEERRKKERSGGGRTARSHVVGSVTLQVV